MNDKIQAILEDSTYDVMGVKQVDQKKFAELIVKECVSIAEAGLAPAVATVIKEHFGVEE